MKRYFKNLRALRKLYVLSLQMEYFDRATGKLYPLWADDVIRRFDEIYEFLKVKREPGSFIPTKLVSDRTKKK